MHHRSIAILAVFAIALSGGGCASNSSRDYEDVLMPLQTGSVLHRRVRVRANAEQKPKKKKKKEASAPKPEAQPSATPVEESTPPPERFR